MSRSVVITGMGAVTPLGENFPDSWQALLAGRDAAAPLRLIDTTGCRAKLAALAALPELSDLPQKIVRRLSRASRLAIPAAREALAMAGLLDDDLRSRIAELPISVSTTAGGMALGEHFFRDVLANRRAHLFSQVARYLPQQQALDLQQVLGFSGPSVIMANACASGANSIGHAAEMVATGAADCVLAGGFEALTELVFVGFDCLQATTTDKCRPFDLNRSGLLLGEAAAFLVLEASDHAAARNAKPLCRLNGYGHTTDFFHLTQPQPDGSALIEVMREAARQAGVRPDEIGYINAHGTATTINDAAEAKAYENFFGDTLPAARISSTKAAIGHTLGAAGSIEALFAIEALLSGDLPPQLNLQNPMPKMATALVKQGEPRRDMTHTMSVNLGFGGSNGALIFSPDMKLDLAIIGQGAVTPVGLGIEPLLKNRPAESLVTELRRPEKSWPVLRVDSSAPELQRWQREPRLRRASAITLFLAAAAEQALAGAELRSETGLIVALSAGCLVYSRRFFKDVVKEGQHRASPALFPETVFNSPGSHVAAALKLNGAVYAVCGDEGAWISALQTASIWLKAGRVRQVLVLGAEEFDPLVLDAYASARWLRNPFRASEGAAGLLVRAAMPGDRLVVSEARDGFIYRTRQEAASAADKLFSGIDSPIYRTAQNNWLGPLERKMTANRPIVSDSAPYLGEAFTASAAWNTIRALGHLSPGLPSIALPVWGLNHQLGALELRPAG